MAKADGSGRIPLSHTALHNFVTSFRLPPPDLPDRSRRVGIVLQDCPEMVVLLLSIMNCSSAVPVNAHMTDDEVLEELRALRVQCVVVGLDNADSVGKALTRTGLDVLVLVPDDRVIGLFSLRQLMPVYAQSAQDEITAEGGPKWAEDPAEEESSHSLSSEALVLRTSGTSGRKKTVCYKLGTLILGSTQVAKSWGLQETDACINMMPLYHVGGIVRNMLAPILAGGAVIVTSGFDPPAFWDIVDGPKLSASGNAAGRFVRSPSWYYAVPTMHIGILEEGRRRYGTAARERTGIRLICNAGGAMPHGLAVELREFFAGATVLPSYGMTECMPIATPPLDYKLERPGTSGVSTGVEIAIYVNGERAKPHVVGHISVRGPPLFDGYEEDPKSTASAFNRDGFFDTGDLGYLDEDGYLFVTGRSKEVINRGGEIISPVEIEDAIRTHQGVKDVIAFVVPHKVLQETVGVAIVPSGSGPRVGLYELQRFVSTNLHPSKWPQLIVYMDSIPKTRNNKPLRIGLAQRLGIAEQTEMTPLADRLFEATCPPTSAPLSEPISCHAVFMDAAALSAAVSSVTGIAEPIAFFHDHHMTLCLPTASPATLIPPTASPASALHASTLLKSLRGHVHDYLLPTKVLFLDVIPRSRDGSPDFEALKATAAQTSSLLTGDMKRLAEIFREALGVEALPEPDDDFFALGGSSLKAGFLMGKIRKTFNASLTPLTIFRFRTPRALLEEIYRVSRGVQSSSGSSISESAKSHHSERAASEKSCPTVASKSPIAPFTLIIQLIPFVIIRPLRTCMTWLSFAFILTLLEQIPPSAANQAADLSIKAPLFRVITLILALGINVTVLWTVFPFFAILMKWIIIGRYKPGRYPLWGAYYLRWWLVDQIFFVFGRGFFGVSSTMLGIHARLMGAKIGKKVAIDSATQLGEFDLIKIESGCALDTARIRPFTMETGYMVLKPIIIGQDSVINAKSVVAPGHSVPSGTVLPPLSSSYEIQDASQEFAPHCRSRLPDPHFLVKALIGYPIILLTALLAYIPWLAVIYQMTSIPYHGGGLPVSSMGRVVLYFATDYRIMYHMLAMAVKHAVSPFLKIIVVIIIKRLIVGKFKAGPVDPRSQRTLVRRWLMNQLLGDGLLCGVYDLVGRHYGIISLIYRALGAKIGRRVYWPGTPLRITELDLVEIGDDVVFGSRSEFIFTSTDGSKPIVIRSGAMVADRCVLLGGAVVGRNCVLGSGSLARADTLYPDASVWIGSQGGGAVLWSDGSPEEAAADTVKPFGRAFYQKQAPFFVYPMWFLVCYNVFLRALAAVLRTTPVVVGVLLAAYEFRLVLEAWFHAPRGTPVPDPTVKALLIFCGGVTATFVSTTLVTTAMDILAKWAIFGRRREGSYDWDKSSYCQRWQVYLSLIQLRMEPLQLVRGSIFLVLYFRALGAAIGRRVCLYPTGSDPMMTEPDLVRIGDHACVDAASIVAHINSKGFFSLNPMHVGSRAVLRAESRVLSGARVEDAATLLEHTLVVSGDVVDDGAVLQGWPAGEFDPARVAGSDDSDGGDPRGGREDVKIFVEPC
ncbi:acetyl-CoA synthetase-like protein [Zopfochytrium polystomum]|nr:acetyl-CoA synthetase-like protein [Zopfochytrium polystomum]